MKFEGICLAVKDIEKSKKFYCNLLQQKIVSDYGINVSFDGGFAIQQDFDWLLGISKDSIVEKSHNMELYFEEENFDDFVETLKAYPDIKFVHDVKIYDWKQRGICIYDPDYHIIGISETFETVVHRLFNEGYSIEEAAKITMQPLEWVQSLKKS